MATDPVTIVEEEPLVEAPSGEPNPALTSAELLAPANDPPAEPALAAAEPADDWRTEFATDNGEVDEKLLGWLGRFQSKASALAAVKKTRDEVSSGKYIKPLGDDATDEEKAAYRGMFGIPETPEGYLEKLPKGLVVGDDDRPGLERVLAKAHAANASPEVANAFIEGYYELVDDQLADAQEAAEQAKIESARILDREWGADYKRNLNVMTAFRQSLPEAVNNVFEYGLMPDGTPVGYNSEVLKWLTAQALERNPHATVVPGAGADQGSAIADEIEQIEAMMGDRSSVYWKGEKGPDGKTSKERRLLTLYEARDRLK